MATNKQPARKTRKVTKPLEKIKPYTSPQPDKTEHRYLDGLLDPATKPTKGWTPAKEHTANQERLLTLAAQALYAETIPRRLGGDADANELKQDKKTCRRVATRAMTCLETWTTELDRAQVRAKALTLADEYKNPTRQKNHAAEIRAAAQVDWAEWWQDHKVWLQNAVRHCAVNAMDHQEPPTDKPDPKYNRKLANKLVHKYKLEWGMFEDILEELDA